MFFLLFYFLTPALFAALFLLLTTVKANSDIIEPWSSRQGVVCVNAHKVTTSASVSHFSILHAYHHHFCAYFFFSAQNGSLLSLLAWSLRLWASHESFADGVINVCCCLQLSSLATSSCWTGATSFASLASHISAHCLLYTLFLFSLAYSLSESYSSTPPYIETIWWTLVRSLARRRLFWPLEVYQRKWAL